LPYHHELPLAVPLSQDIEHRPGSKRPYKTRVRWVDPQSKRRRSVAQMRSTEEAAHAWIGSLLRSAARGIDRGTATRTLAEYGDSHMELALRGLEPKTTDPDLAGWRLRVVPALGHLPVTAVTNGAVGRTAYAWIADGEGRSTVKNTLAGLVRGMEQAVRDGLITANPARISGWQPAGPSPPPGDLADKNAKGKIARRVPIIEELRPMVAERILAAGSRPDARLFTGPRGGRSTTAILRDATHWDDIVQALGHEHLRRHDLRHTGLTLMADTGVSLHVLRLIAGHGSLHTTQRYLNPYLQSVTHAGHSLSNQLTGTRTPPPPPPAQAATLRRLQEPHKYVSPSARS
jgi:hypothetical protein